MLSPSTILTSGCISAIVIAGLTFLADSSTRAQLDRALETARVSRASAPVSVSTMARKGSHSALDRKRLETMVMMVSQPLDD